MFTHNTLYWICLFPFYFLLVFISTLLIYKLSKASFHLIYKLNHRKKQPYLNLKAFLSYLKNSKDLVKRCRQLIHQYESNSEYVSFAPSCFDDLMKAIEERVSAERKDISSWDNLDVDYNEIAHKLLSNASFELLASGKYHIYYGVLSPMSCATNLKRVHEKSMEWALNHGYATEEEVAEDSKSLIYCIAHVG